MKQMRHDGTSEAGSLRVGCEMLRRRLLRRTDAAATDQSNDQNDHESHQYPSVIERVKNLELRPGRNETKDRKKRQVGHQSDEEILGEIDNVRNLPQYATLQEMFAKQSSLYDVHRPRKAPKMPIMKLTKDDWNVRCWEELLAKKEAQRNAAARREVVNIDNESTTKRSTKNVRPAKQIEVFRDRIRHMSQKLDSVTAGQPDKPLSRDHIIGSSETANSHQWLDMLRHELFDAKTSSVSPRRVGRLFDDDDDD